MFSRWIDGWMDGYVGGWLDGSIEWWNGTGWNAFIGSMLHEWNGSWTNEWEIVSSWEREREMTTLSIYTIDNDSNPSSAPQVWNSPWGSWLCSRRLQVRYKWIDQCILFEDTCLLSLTAWLFAWLLYFPEERAKDKGTNTIGSRLNRMEEKVGLWMTWQ